MGKGEVDVTGEVTSCSSSIRSVTTVVYYASDCTDAECLYEHFTKITHSLRNFRSELSEKHFKCVKKY